MTIAEEIAEELEHDPERFETRKRGVSLETLCERHQGRLELAVRETNDDGVGRVEVGDAKVEIDPNGWLLKARDQRR